MANPFLASMKAAVRAATGPNRHNVFKHAEHAFDLSGAPRHPTHIMKPSDFIPRENMSLGLRLDEVTPSASGGATSAKLRDKLRRKHGLKT